MAENLINCPVCGSELFISGEVVYCSNPKCNYSSDIASAQKSYKKEHLTIILPLAFLFIAIGLILIFVSMIFINTTVFFIFIPPIIPIPLLRKIFKRRRRTPKSKSE